MESKNFLEKNLKKIFFSPNKSGIIFLVLSILFLVLSGDFCWANQVIEWTQEVIATAFWKIAQLAGVFLGMAMWFLNLVTSEDFYNKVLFNDRALLAINIGWAVVRDFLNLFFILILLLIAIGTILRVPSYGDKKMVFSVVLAALLINFSKSIALVFIDISQLAMNFFMSALEFNDGRNFSDFILNKIQFQKVLSATDKGVGMDLTGSIIISVSATIFFLVMAVMMFTLAVSLLVRVVAYWILIILSPMAMFGLAMPRTGLGSLNRDWVQKMLYWSFFGPVMMFFLWLATLILVQVINYDSLKETGFFDNIPAVKEDKRELILDLFEVIIPYVASIYLLFYGYNTSMAVSTGAAKNILNYGGQKIKQYGKKIGKWSAIGGIGGIGAMAGGALGVAGVAAGVGAYYGGRRLFREAKENLKNRVGGWVQGYREKIGDKYPFLQNEEQKKKKRAMQREEQIARIKGGDDEKKYWRGRANQQKKEWDDFGVDDNFLQDKMKNGDEAERKASALLLAERGKIKKATDFNDVLEVIKGDKVLEGKIRKSLKEEHIHPMLESDIMSAWSNLNAFTASEDSIFEAVKNNDLMKKMVMHAKIPLTDKKRLKVYFDELKSDATGEKFNKAAYFGQLDSMRLSEIFKQKEFFNDQIARKHVEEYLKENTTTLGGFSKGRNFTMNKLKKEIGKMSDANTEINAMNMINSIYKNENKKEIGKMSDANTEINATNETNSVNKNENKKEIGKMSDANTEINATNETNSINKNENKK